MYTPTVAHVRDIFLAQTETWLYSYLDHFSTYRPIVLARRIANLESFPFQELYAPPQKIDFLSWRLWNDFWRLLVTQAGILPPGYDIGYRYFSRIICQEKAVLLHAHFGQEGVRLLPLKAETGLPLITTFYGYDMSLLPHRFPWLWKGHYQRLFSEGDLFLIEGNHMRQKLIELGCPAEKAYIQHIGVDTKKFTYNPRVLTGDKVIVLFCGSFVAKKGLIYALEAVRQVVQDYPQMEFRIIGGGPLKKKLQAFVTRHGLEQWVTWLGYQPHHVFAEELQRAHIFIHPSITTLGGDSEGGAPTTLLEAQATGIPVLSTYHADIPEVVVDGHGGYLVPERDTKALAQRLRELICHSAEWAEMGYLGRKHIEQNYETIKETLKLEHIYNILLKG